MYVVGDSFDIALEALSTAGYAWTVDTQEAERRLEYLGDSWENPPGELVGTASRQRFRFRAIAPGTATLHFSYGRSWEPKPERTIDYVIRVADVARD
jgi:predicted secreted protein